MSSIYISLEIHLQKSFNQNSEKEDTCHECISEDESKMAGSAFLVIMRGAAVLGEGCPDLCGLSSLTLMSQHFHRHLMNVAGCG